MLLGKLIVAAGFEPLKILVKESAGYVKWQTGLRIEPKVQLEYENPVIRECDYRISNLGPAACLEPNPGGLV